MNMKTRLKLGALIILLGVAIAVVIADWLLPLALLKWIL